MRLHQLTVTAFGPFAGTERVHFDELNAAGLFLLTGPTGAGKSSLLDAVCFALYGTVPGARGVKALKSQHAPRDMSPEVVLDFSVQGRRFVVRRTPEWTRPKKRGDGLLAEKASASIIETTTGTEHFLSSRAAEVGLLVTELMGMNAAQFAQVALLPQGEFQTFLRASSQDRHAVLQHLFHTDRFARIEDWVSERSRNLKDLAGSGESVVQRILDTVADRADVETPDRLTGTALAQAAAEDQVLPWVAELLEGAEVDAQSCRAQQEEAHAALIVLRRRHEASTRWFERRARVQAARLTLASLEESEDTAVAARATLLADDRADRCSPVLALRAQALEARDKASGERDRSVSALLSSSAPTALGVRLEPMSGEVVSSALEAARGRSARLSALLPRERAAGEARRDRDAERSLLLAAEEEHRVSAAKLEQIPVDLEARTTLSSAAASRAARHEALTQALTAARERHLASVALDEVRDELLALDDVRRDARDRVQDAREHTHDLMSRRLSGMAAELAGSLADGAACQVCGSIDHPRPASPADDAVTVDDQDHADRALSAREADLETAVQDVQRLQRRRDSLLSATGGLSRAESEAAVDGLVVELRDASDARRELLVLEAEIRTLRDEQQTLGRRQLESTAAAAGLRESIAAHERTVSAVGTEVSEVLGDLSGHGTVAGALSASTELVDRLADAGQAIRDLAEAGARLDALTEQAVTLAHGLGFSTLEEIEAAALPAEDRQRLTTVLTERTAARSQALAVLDDPEAPVTSDDQGDEADHDPEDPEDPENPEDLDLAELSASLSDAEQAAADAGRRLALREDRVTALQLHLGRLRTAMAAWAPVRDEALRAESMSKLIRGMGHDNQLQMRLSAYVLATRLDQVVAAANERLGQMRDQRYLLQRTGRAERKTSQAGLGLEILDQWTGDVRAPTTLSGGETFVVSLSLALGLADVVTQESGGTEVETLFVDEGFGTLDADTLDDVMDRLDGLRAGGRTVGVVSHVTELRSRIPTQLQVDKGRAGSVVTVRTLVG